MKYCPVCKVYYNTTKVKCPLCKEILSEELEKESAIQTVYQDFPKIRDNRKSLSLKNRVMILITILIISVSLLLNLFYLGVPSINSLWSISTVLLVATIAIFYKAVYDDRHHFHYYFPIFLFLLAMFSASIEYLIDLDRNLYSELLKYLFNIEPITNFYTLLFVFPFLLTLGVLIFAARSVFQRNHYKNDMIFIFGLSLICIGADIVISSIHYFTKPELFVYVGCTLICSFTIVSLFILAPRKTIIQLAKLFSI